MSKQTLSVEIIKELEKLNDSIDRAIIKGRSYEKQARRHQELTATLRRINEETKEPVYSSKKSSRRVKSPVHRRLAGGSVRRMFGIRFA